MSQLDTKPPKVNEQQEGSPVVPPLSNVPGIGVQPLDNNVSIRGGKRRGEFPNEFFQTPPNPRPGDYYHDTTLNKVLFYTQEIWNGFGVDERTPETDYVTGDYVVESGVLYSANTDHNSGASFNAALWDRQSILRRWTVNEREYLLETPAPVSVTNITDTTLLEKTMPDDMRVLIIGVIRWETGILDRRIKLNIGGSTVWEYDVIGDVQTVVTGSQVIPVVGGMGGSVTVPVYGNGPYAQPHTMQIVRVENVNRNDIVELIGFQTSGGNLDAEAYLHIQEV